MTCMVLAVYIIQRMNIKYERLCEGFDGVVCRAKTRGNLLLRRKDLFEDGRVQGLKRFLINTSDT